MALVIRTFRCEETAKVARRERSRKFVNIAAQAQIRLDRLNAATSLQDLRNFRSNNLEALKGDLAGRFSIRVNDRYRICFEWRGEDAWEVEIVDYH